MAVAVKIHACLSFQVNKTKQKEENHILFSFDYLLYALKIILGLYLFRIFTQMTKEIMYINRGVDKYSN